MSGFRLQIVTPDGSVYDGQAEALRLRTSEGYVSIRAGHADYIDVERAESAKKRAEERLAQAREERDIAIAKAKLSRALNRIDVAEKSG